MLRARHPAGDGVPRRSDTARDVLAHHAPAVTGVRGPLSGSAAVAARVTEEGVHGHIARVRAGRARQGRCERERRCGRKALRAAGARVRTRLIGEREHEPADGGGVPLGRCHERLCHDDRQAAPATAVDADVAQIRIGDRAAEPLPDDLLDRRIAARARDPNPQRARRDITGARLRLLERFAVREQAGGLIQPAALDERRMAGARQAAVRAAGGVDRGDGVGEQRCRREQQQKQRCAQCAQRPLSAALRCRARAPPAWATGNTTHWCARKRAGRKASR